MRLSPSSRHAAAFTLLELMVAMTMSAIVLVATLFGIVALQRSYASTEEYANGMADQMRLLDYLALDLRRAVAVPANGSTAAQAPWIMDADGQGLTVNVPSYYVFNGSDPQHVFPIANNPVYDPTTAVVTYTSGGATTQKISYRFDNGAITRSDPWQARTYSRGSRSYVSTGPVTIASNMDKFPTITADTSDGTVVHYAVTFHSIFRTGAAADSTNAVNLDNITFIRSKNLSH